MSYYTFLDNTSSQHAGILSLTQNINTCSLERFCFGFCFLPKWKTPTGPPLAQVLVTVVAENPFLSCNWAGPITEIPVNQWKIHSNVYIMFQLHSLIFTTCFTFSKVKFQGILTHIDVFELTDSSWWIGETWFPSHGHLYQSCSQRTIPPWSRMFQ